jgi:hypothetical protein
VIPDPGSPCHVKVRGQLVTATYVGWDHQWGMAVVEYKGDRLKRSLLHPTGSRIFKNGELPAGAKAVPAPTASEQPLISPCVTKETRFTVHQRFGFIATLADMVAQKQAKSLVVTGSGGLGKTFEVLAAMKRNNLVEDEDYMVIKGFSTPKSMYRCLWENAERIVIFDDCDSVFDNVTAISILKSALDSYEKRIVCWLTELVREGDDLPQRFEFKGGIIFVSNLSLGDIDQTILSRALFVDVSMTAKEKIDRIKALAAAMRPDLSMKAKLGIIKHLNGLRDKIGDLNIRSFLKTCEIYSANPKQWKNVSEYVLTAI